MSGKLPSSEKKVKAILEQKFEKVHVEAILKHFVSAKRKYQESDWEGSILKSGKFVEAVTKAFLKFCGKTLPRIRNFRAGNILRNFEQEPVTVDDTIRIVIPKCCNVKRFAAEDAFRFVPPIAKNKMRIDDVCSEKKS